MNDIVSGLSCGTPFRIVGNRNVSQEFLELFRSSQCFSEWRDSVQHYRCLSHLEWWS
jgi:hypothetical protein